MRVAEVARAVTAVLKRMMEGQRSKRREAHSTWGEDQGGVWGRQRQASGRGQKTEVEVIYSNADWRRSRWPLHGSSPIGTSVTVRYRQSATPSISFDARAYLLLDEENYTTRIMEIN
jgi:hypothetical protein